MIYPLIEETIIKKNRKNISHLKMVILLSIQLLQNIKLLVKSYWIKMMYPSNWN